MNADIVRLHRQVSTTHESRAGALRKLIAHCDDFVDATALETGEHYPNALAYQRAVVREARMMLEVALVSAVEESKHE